MLRTSPPDLAVGHFAEWARRWTSSTLDDLAALDELLATLPALVTDYRERLQRGIPFGPTQMSDTSASVLHALYPRVSASSLSNLRESILRSNGQVSDCAYCEIGEAIAIDHYLPSSTHPEFSLESLNLVPVCTRCNGRKLAVVPEPGKRLPHAYLDPEVGFQFLFATWSISEGTPIAKFELIIPPLVDPATSLGIEFLFERLHLLERYDVETQRELATTISHHLEHNPPLLRTWIAAERDRLLSTKSPNHWMTAAYVGLHNAIATGWAA